MKRFFALCVAVLFLLFCLTSLAEDEFDDFDDYGDEEMEMDGEDLAEMTEDDFNNAKAAMNAASGNHETFLQEGDYIYEFIPEDSSSCKIIKYDGIDWDVDIPEKVADMNVSILEKTFFNNYFVETVILPETVQKIDIMSFYSCTCLKEVTIQEGVTEIGQCAFGGCSLLEKLELPESLITVEDFAFIACNCMKEFKFGKNLKSIGSNAFNGCQTLEKIIVPRGAEIADDAFTDCPMFTEIEYYDPEE